MRPSLSSSSKSQHFILQNLCLWQIQRQRLLPGRLGWTFNAAFWICWWTCRLRRIRLVSNRHRLFWIPMRWTRISQCLHPSHRVHRLDTASNTTSGGLKINNLLTLCIWWMGIRPRWSTSWPVDLPAFPCQNYGMPPCWDRSTFEMQSACPRRKPANTEIVNTQWGFNRLYYHPQVSQLVLGRKLLFSKLLKIQKFLSKLFITNFHDIFFCLSWHLEIFCFIHVQNLLGHPVG